MKTRTWIALLLAVALVIPAAAQQTSPQSNPDQSQSQPAAQTQQAQPADQMQPTQPADQATSPREPLKVERHEGFWGKLNPFARKKYVQRQLSPIADRTNELDELTSQNAKMIRDVDARAQEGIRTASAKANEADQHAVEAGNRAQMAHQTALDASNRLQTIQQVVATSDQYKPVTQTELRFRPGQAVLSMKAKGALDEVATSLKDQKGYIVEVQGFSSGRGAEAVENSRRMADAVVRYLVINHEVPVYRVRMLGLGNTPLPAAEGEKPRRVRGGRVEVTLLKNDLEQLASAQPIGAPAATSVPSSPATIQNPSTPTTPAVEKPAPNEQKPPDVPRQ